MFDQMRAVFHVMMFLHDASPIVAFLLTILTAILGIFSVYPPK